jgi:hypothetical protein
MFNSIAQISLNAAIFLIRGIKDSLLSKNLIFFHAVVYSNPTSAAAKKFLLELIQKSPFPIKSIQVDCGSEFMAHFENACKELNIPLVVLPAAKPEYNSGTERGNRIFREEFYDQPRF